MNKCPYCESKEVSTRSVRKNQSGVSKQRYQCNHCHKWFSVTLETENPLNSVFEVCSEPTIRRYVVSACQNNVPVHTEFLKTLSSYCTKNKAELLIVPILYNTIEYEKVEFNIPTEISHTIVDHKLWLHDEVCVMGSFNFNPVVANPLQGLESLSKGDTLIVPSPQLRMKSMAVSATRHPAILHTTGAVSRPEYSKTKSGEKAKFNHTYSAILVEIDINNLFHIRVLNSDDSGMFYDIGYKYTPDGKVEFEGVEALVTGDEHAIFACPMVEKATYTNEDSIVRTLKPNYVVRHDVLDSNSISHHTRKNTITNIGKYEFNMNKIEDELDATIEYICRTTLIPETHFTNIIVSSNHNSHLLKWFNEIDIKTEPWNARFYFKYMSKILESMEKTETGIKHIDPFEQYCVDNGLQYTRFLKSDESFKIADVELSYHGHMGQNGAKGSLVQYSNLCDKTVSAHTHTPAIILGAYQVGTSSYLKLDYTSGLSSWANYHCLVYKNGKRQLIGIREGKWKA